MTTAVGLGAAMVIAAGPAAAARPDLPQQVGTTHILVHYTTTGLDAITEQLAQSTANDAENAYGIYEGLGFRPPVSDGVLGGDGRVDVYMTQADLTSIEGGLADGDVAIGRPWGWIQLRPAAAVFKALVAHELFHLVEFAYNRYEASWLMESGAEWAAGVVEGGGTIPPVVGSFLLPLGDSPLDCAACDPYVRAPFFDLLAARYGVGVIREIWLESEAMGVGKTHSLSAVLAGVKKSGGSMSDVWNEYAAQVFIGNFPETFAGDTTTIVGTKTVTLPTQTITLPHLALHFVAYRGAESGSCTKSDLAGEGGTLHVRVQLPTGSPAIPVLSFREDTRNHDLRPVVTKLTPVNGVASIDVPHWRACSVAALALPSSAVDDDAQSFIVQTSLTGAVAAPTPKTTPAQPKPHPKAKPKHQRKRRKR